MKESDKCVRKLEEGCDIRIGELEKMMDVMVAEKHGGLASKGGRREKLGSIHFVAFFSYSYFYISNRSKIKWLC